MQVSNEELARSCWTSGPATGQPVEANCTGEAEALPSSDELEAGFGQFGQVVGRLGYARFAAATSVTARGVLVLAGVAVTTAGLALAPASSGLLIVIGMVLGLARGVYTLVQATAVTDRWGPASYGALNGLLTAPALVAAAAAPFAGAVRAELLGSWADAFLALAGVMYATRNIDWASVGRSEEEIA